MKPLRKTHPQAPLFYPPPVILTPEQIAQINVDFTQLTGQASNAQVPASAVTQYQALLSIAFTQLTGSIANGQVPSAAVLQHLALILASAALTGTPTTPTAAPGTNTTQVASTAFVLANAGGSMARADVVIVTASLANNAVEAGTVSMGRSSLVLRFTGSCACRIRLYTTAAHRTADAARLPGTDPLGMHGVMLDIVLEAGITTWDLSPLALITNDDGPPVSNIYYAIQNMSGATVAVTATLTRLTLET